MDFDTPVRSDRSSSDGDADIGSPSFRNSDSLCVMLYRIETIFAVQTVQRKVAQFANYFPTTPRMQNFKN
jgi:hypothetical protein